MHVTIVQTTALCQDGVKHHAICDLVCYRLSASHREYLDDTRESQGKEGTHAKEKIA